MENHFSVGDKVAVKKEYHQVFVLHCGTGFYPHAIVESVEPFHLLSSDGSMRWSATIKPEYFEVIDFATEAEFQAMANRQFSEKYGMNIAALETDMTKIASKYLRFSTLVPRHRDSLDFKEVSCWGVKDALRAAFEAGFAQAKHLEAVENARREQEKLREEATMS